MHVKIANSKNHSNLNIVMNLNVHKIHLKLKNNVKEIV